jgi:hypothetical protein
MFPSPHHPDTSIPHFGAMYCRAVASSKRGILKARCELRLILEGWNTPRCCLSHERKRQLLMVLVRKWCHFLYPLREAFSLLSTCPLM